MIKELWPGGPPFKEEKGVFPVGMDSVLLADFANRTQLRKKNRAIDLGCGSGIVSILLALHNRQLTVDGLEIQPQAARLSAENASLSRRPEQINIIEGDLRYCLGNLIPGAYDLTVSNPPYFEFRSGKRPKDKASATARGNESCTLDDICKAAKYLTRFGGALIMTQKPERLAVAFQVMNLHGFEPKRLRFVSDMQSSPPNLVLIEGRRGAKPSLKIEAPLILKDDDGGDSDEIKVIYRLQS